MKRNNFGKKLFARSLASRPRNAEGRKTNARDHPLEITRVFDWASNPANVIISYWRGYSRFRYPSIFQRFESSHRPLMSKECRRTGFDYPLVPIVGYRNRARTVRPWPVSTWLRERLYWRPASICNLDPPRKLMIITTNFQCTST